MTILAIDPGPSESAYVVWNGSTIEEFGKLENQAFRRRLMEWAAFQAIPIVCEKIACYGMSVGASVFLTCFWTGRFWEIASVPAGCFNRFHLVERLKVKMHLCHDSKAKDSNIRTAIIDRFGPPGTKNAKGLTYGLSKDLWAAFALAITWNDLNAAESRQ